MRECHKGCEPETDETGIECGGDFLGEACVVLNQNTYFDIVEGDRLTTFIIKVGVKIQNLFNNKVSTNLAQYSDDTTAAAGGVLLGKNYVDLNGFVRQRIV